MGTVLSFNSSRRFERSLHRCAPQRPGHQAEVVIFPGVRMERDTLDLAARIGRKQENGPHRGADRDPVRPL
ncbi:hypothetical protein [Stappia stellulata]|uniref:hypothetical protein n=1 Tax=Stappia stellulata TaxID=71235 RepID=UPI0009FDEB31|nr:hypothetical protein [Stappia stellulata]